MQPKILNLKFWECKMQNEISECDEFGKKKKKKIRYLNIQSDVLQNKKGKAFFSANQRICKIVQKYNMNALEKLFYTLSYQNIYIIA